MPKSLENPFLPPQDAKPNLSALAEQGFLPPDEVAKLKELEDQKDRSSKFEVPSSMSDVSLKEGMTSEEKARQEEELYEKDPKHTRVRLIKWAKKFDLGDEGWVDTMFEFQPDGSAISKSSLFLESRDITFFPKGIKKVRGSLYLSNNKIKTIENLPESIHGDLTLEGNPATRMQPGIHITGDICLLKNQTSLHEDCIVLGYATHVY